jgi:hypothetical protein
MTTRWTPSLTWPLRRSPFGDKSLQRSAWAIASPAKRPAPRWTAEDLLDGTEVEIGADVWRIDGSLLLWSGQWAFRLTPANGSAARPGSARLLVPAEDPPQDGPAPVWTFIQEGGRSLLPSDRVRLHFGNRRE